MTRRRGRVVAADVRGMVGRRPHRLPEEWRFVPRVVKVVVQLALVVPVVDDIQCFRENNHKMAIL